MLWKMSVILVNPDLMAPWMLWEWKWVSSHQNTAEHDMMLWPMPANPPAADWSPWFDSKCCHFVWISKSFFFFSVPRINQPCFFYLFIFCSYHMTVWFSLPWLRPWTCGSKCDTAGISLCSVLMSPWSSLSVFFKPSMCLKTKQL